VQDKRHAARFLGVWGIGAFVGTAVGPLLGGPLLYAFGHTDTAGVYSLRGYAMLLGASALYFAASAWMVSKVRLNGPKEILEHGAEAHN
jgi:MFS family permease